MEAPYTKEELRAMSDKEVLALPKKCPRLHPYCLIGLHIDEVRNRMDEWGKQIGMKSVMMINGDACYMDPNVKYWYCEIDENGIMTDVRDAFEGMR